MRSRFLAVQVRPANRDILRGHDGVPPALWLLAQWPPGEHEPTDHWLSTLPTPPHSRPWSIWPRPAGGSNNDYRELKTGLGLDHFEGRSCLGWHRHVTLTALAQVFCTLLRLDPKADAPA
jgi:SRSO17 transposase